MVTKRSPGLKRLAYKINSLLIDSQVNIPVKNLFCTYPDLMREINKQRLLARSESE